MSNTNPPTPKLIFNCTSAPIIYCFIEYLYFKFNDSQYLYPLPSTHSHTNLKNIKRPRHLQETLLAMSLASTSYELSCDLQSTLIWCLMTHTSVLRRKVDRIQQYVCLRLSSRNNKPRVNSLEKSTKLFPLLFV